MLRKAIILALGSPLQIGDIGSRRTRAMLPIVGKPFAVRVMERLRKHGIKEFIVLLGKHDGVLATYLNESWYPDAKLEFVMHTGSNASVNSLLSAQASITELCLVTTVDQLVSYEDYGKLLSETTPDTKALSFLSTGDTLLPVGIITPAFVDFAAQATSTHGASLSLQDLIQGLIDQPNELSVKSIPVNSVQFLNSSRDLLIINQHYLDDGIGSYILSELDSSVSINPPVRIDPGVRVGNGAAIGPYVYLETGARIGAGAVVSNSVVLQRGIVMENQTCDNLVIAKGQTQ